MKWLKIKAILLTTALLSLWTSFAVADTQFRIIVDASGSMQTSDPDRLTSEALRLLSELSPDETSSLGVWLFGEEPRVLLPESLVNDDSRATLARYVSHYVTQDVKTDLEAILRLLLDTPDSEDLSLNIDRHWILVTDGFVDISLDDAVNKASRDRILSELVGELNDLNVHLHTVSMTGYTDKALLNAISLQTNASHTEVAVPDDLLDTFDCIFSQALVSNELPLDGNRFYVDESIERLSLLTFHEPGVTPELLHPDGSSLLLSNREAVSVKESAHYTIIELLKPEVGDWQVNQADMNRTRVRIVSPLTIQATPLPTVVFQNEPIATQVSLLRGSQPLNATQTLMRLNGDLKETLYTQSMTQNAEQFEQTLSGIESPGHYELRTEINGAGVFRQISQVITVSPAIELTGSLSGGNLVSFSATPTIDQLDLLRSELTLELSYSNGTTNTETMSLLNQGYWEKIIPVVADDNVTVQGHFRGVTSRGTTFDYLTPTWRFARVGDAAPSVGLVQAITQVAAVLPDMAGNKNLAPMQIAPTFTLVNSDDIEDSEMSQGEPKVAPKVEKVIASARDLSSTNASLYLAISGVVLIIFIAVWWYRRQKHQSLNQDGLDNV
ncbi:VWA domain-containing protein [Marinomonas sp. A79]|uniref:VWA domain-containing protein n=1 Tax=Marinomonas vulgaris TaxID=2823372 RepID=A0ABS5H885_9GAMM|nr:vWA domain-containing protein [Marinomonas vulgaris]MBR7887908.1 VWA domain-containing protein [Marinomonas vulgaris]